jgi:hypothetical protein
MTHDRDAQGADSGQVTAGLDAAFAALRADPVLPPRGLQARVLAEAHAWQDRPVAAPRPAVRAVARPSRFAAIWASLGGWSGGTGLVAATMVGLVVGFGAPDVVAGVTGSGTSDDAAVAAWLWPDVGTVIDGLSAAGEG